MFLRANRALQTACHGARAAGWRRASRPAIAVRPRGAPVLQLPRIRRKNMPVSLTAPLQFLPTRGGRRFLFPAPDSSLERRSNGRSSGRTFAGIRVAGCSGPWTSKIPHAPSGAQAATTRRGADARARRARAGRRARSPRSPTSGAAEPITPRWYAPCSFNEAPPPGGASKWREES
jgi:hypothetical protein